MLDPRATVAAAAKNPDLVNKIAFFQWIILWWRNLCNSFTPNGKYTLTNNCSMKQLLFLLLALPLLSADCGSERLPACLRRIIADATKNEPANTPEQIDEYLYKGERVFLFTAPCCDQYNTVYDMKCNPVCAPSGGITGKGDGRCTDFKDSAKFVRTLWSKKDSGQ